MLYLLGKAPKDIKVANCLLHETKKLNFKVNALCIFQQFHLIDIFLVIFFTDYPLAKHLFVDGWMVFFIGNKYKYCHLKWNNKHTSNLAKASIKCFFLFSNNNLRWRKFSVSVKNRKDFFRNCENFLKKQANEWKNFDVWI
jgi:hypothetical protein